MTDTRADRAKQAADQRKAGNGEPAGGEIVKADPVKQMLDTWMPEIEKQMPLQVKVNPQAWARVALTGLKNSKQAAALAKCTRPSLYAAFLEAARFGLTPFTDEAAIVPYKDVATFIPMAQGFVRLFWNTGQVSAVVVDFIRKGEVKGRDWNISRGPGGRGFWHEPRYVDEDGEPVQRGEPILAYCYLAFKDGSCSEPAIVDRWDAEDVMRNKSRAWQYAEFVSKKRDSLWHTDFPAMWLKTAVRRAAKYGPKSAELQELLLIEAREDRTRSDAPVPPAIAPPMGEGAGVDWSADMDGGNVIAGSVADDNEDAPPPDPEPLTRRQATDQIRAVFKAANLGGPAQAATRDAVFTALLPELGGPVTAASELSDDHVRLVAERLSAQAKAAGEAGTDLAVELAGLAERAGHGQEAGQ